MKRKILFFGLMAWLNLCGYQLMAQSVGSYDTTITFMAANRTISMHVPTSYTSAVPHRLMICLHGLGDNSVNYRNALINSLGWNTAYPQTIFICPESSNINSDYYVPAGSEAIIQSCINLAKAHYTIDTTQIILQGFSLGGRAALRYGLDHPTDFKGLFLNTPAVQGVKNALNDQPTYMYNYSASSKIPIYISFGATDFTYTSAIDTTVEQLILNNHPVRYDIFPSLGHTIPSNSLMPNIFSYCAHPNSAGYDLDIRRIYMADRTCGATGSASCLVRNVGDFPLNAMELDYTVNGTTQTYTWTGNLAPFEHAIVTLPSFPLTTGSQDLDVKVKTLNAGILDTFDTNNERSQAIMKGSPGNDLQVLEGFEGNSFPPPGWVAERYEEDYNYWELDDQVYLSGTQSTYAFNTIFIFDNQGRKAELLSPVLNFNTSAHASLSFDYAFNYMKYTPPYFVDTTIFTDTLEILISTDCGNTYQSLYKKWGAQLATFANPMLNPLNINACFINPADSNWKHEEINLSAFQAATEAVVKFSYTSGLGGNINMDNVRFSNYPLSVSTENLQEMEIYPNPSDHLIHIESKQEPIQQVRVTDMFGRIVYTEKMTSAPVTKITLTSRDWANGMYWIECITSSQQRLLSKHQVMH